MHFRSYSDLARTLTTHLARVPADVDVIVGVPRSGLIPASVLSLSLNLPMTDVEGLIAGRLVVTGMTRRSGRGITSLADCCHALVVDDSILSGRTLASVRQQIGAAQLPLKVSYAAVYATKDTTRAVDCYFEVCGRPRFFEWNYLHHHYLASALVDLDGVLGVDATEVNVMTPAQRQDYFARTVPRVRPTHRILALTSCCSHDVLPDLAGWLARHQIIADQLLLMEGDSACPPPLDYLAFKIDVFRREPRALLFLDGDAAHSHALAMQSRKTVINVHEPRLYEPPPTWWSRIRKRTQRLQQRASAWLTPPGRRDPAGRAPHGRS